MRTAVMETEGEDMQVNVLNNRAYESICGMGSVVNEITI